eukprot:313508_1
MLCCRNINYLRKSLSFSTKHIHLNSLYQSTNTFCTMTKLQKPSIIVNEDSIIESIKQKTKSDELTNYLSNLNLKKSGNKHDKTRRLINHFNSNYENLNGMNEISLKSYCNLFNISIDENLSKNELISNLLSVTVAKNDSSNIETFMDADINEPEPAVPSFGFQMDQERENQILEAKLEEETQLVEIDEKQSFLHKYPINICSKVTFDNESEIIFETSRIGHLSESAIIVNCKGTIVLTTATSQLKSELKFDDGLDLKVDAHERSWPRGYIPSGIQRNDGGITDYEILLCRMIDRSIRPLFILDDNDNNSNKILPAFEVQILSNLLSCDDIYDSQVLAINGASASVYCSSNINIGNNGPIGAVRVIIDKNNEMICNPTKLQMDDIETKCNLLYVGTNDKCVMIETEANIINENKYGQLLQFAQENVSKITDCIKQLKQLKQLKMENDVEKKELINLQNENIMNKYQKLSEYKTQLFCESIIKETERELFNLYSSNISKNNRNLKREILCKQMICDLNINNINNIDNNILTSNEWIEFYKSLFYECDNKQ